MSEPGVPVFPGGMDSAPEVTRRHCGHESCLCHAESGTQFCSLACARGRSQDGVCICGHYGCSYHRA